jgi:hypothetical protein
MTKGVLFAGAGEWKVQGKSGSRPTKRDCGDKMVSDNTAASVGGLPAAASERPVWLNDLSPKGSPPKAQSATKKKIGALSRAGVYTLLKKVGKVKVLEKAVAVEPVKEAD